MWQVTRTATLTHTVMAMVSLGPRAASTPVMGTVTAGMGTVTAGMGMGTAGTAAPDDS